MIKQTVGPERVSALDGIKLIALIVACLLLGSFAGNALLYIGLPNIVGTIAFFGLGVALAAWVFFKYAVSYLYTLDGVKLTVERVYGRYPRFFAQVLKREIVFLGAEADAREKYPGARATRAYKRDSVIEAQALVYRREGEYHMLLLKPNQEIKDQLNSK